MKTPEGEDPHLFSASAAMLFDALLQQTQDQVYFKDRHSRFIRVSDVMPAKFGLETPDDLIGKTLEAAIGEKGSVPGRGVRAFSYASLSAG